MTSSNKSGEDDDYPASAASSSSTNKRTDVDPVVTDDVTNNLITNGLVQYIDDLHGQGITTIGNSLCELVDSDQENVVNTNNYDANDDDVQRKISETNENNLPIGYIDDDSSVTEYVKSDKDFADRNHYREITDVYELNGNSGNQQFNLGQKCDENEVVENIDIQVDTTNEMFQYIEDDSHQSMAYYKNENNAVDNNQISFGQVYKFSENCVNKI